jgi:glycosyltransferase involved in cell wall biosynthesis
MTAGLLNKTILFLYDQQTLCPRVQIQMDSLKSRGAEIVLARWVRDRCTEPPCREAVTLDVEVPGATGTAGIIFALPRLYRALRKAVAPVRYDLIHVGHLALLPLALWLAHSRKVPVIYDAREFWALDYARHFGPLRSVMQQVLEALENRLITRVGAIFCINSHEGFLLRRYQKYNPQSLMLNNFPKLFTDTDQHQDYPSNFLKSDNSSIAYVGGFSPREGALEILEALQQVRSNGLKVDFLLIGSKPSSKKENDSLWQEIKRRDYITTLPFIPYPAMMAHLSFARIGLALFHFQGRYPLLGLGNSRKLFSYMEAGLPVIVSRHPVMAAIVNETGCGLVVDESSPAEIAQAITYVLEHPEAAQEMGRRGRQAMEQKYNWSTEEPKFLRGVSRSLGLSYEVH